MLLPIDDDDDDDDDDDGDGVRQGVKRMGCRCFAAIRNSSLVW